MSLYFDNNKLFDAEGHLTDEGLYAIKDGTLDDLGALEAAEHLSFCDYCLLRYTAMIDAAPDCMKQPIRDLIPQVQSLMRLRSFRIMTNRYVSAAAAVVLGFVMWGAVSTFGVPNPAALLPQQPAARQERFGTKFNTAVNGFYKSLDDTFKSFTLTAENGLDQIRAQSIGGSTAKGGINHEKKRLSDLYLRLYPGRRADVLRLYAARPVDCDDADTLCDGGHRRSTAAVPLPCHLDVQLF